MAFTTPDLPYDYNALEPHIDEQTMKIHHDKHHVAYTNKLNATLEGHDDLLAKTPEWIIDNLEEVPQEIRQKVTNFVGGHVNHDFFWHCMKKDVPAQGPVVDKITEQWGSLDAFKEEFNNAASTLFGSGWTWLVKDSEDNLAIVNTQNQDNPRSDGMKPLLGIDVWEHAFYLKYKQNKPEYVNNWWNVVNWDFVNQQYEE